MRLFTSIILSIAICLFWLSTACSQNETPTETPTSTPTINESPTLTPTPTVTRIPDQNVEHAGLFPSVKFYKTDASLHYDSWDMDHMAVHPKTGELYVYSPTQNQLKIFAQHGQSLIRKSSIHEPIELEEDEMLGGIDHAFDITVDAKGDLYIVAPSQINGNVFILRLPYGHDRLELLYTLNYDERIHYDIVSIFVIDGFTNVIGFDENGILFIATTLDEEGNPYGTLYFLKDGEDTAEPILEMKGQHEKFTRMILGPNNHLYINKGTPFSHIHRVEEDHTYTTLYDPSSPFDIRNITDMAYDQTNQTFLLCSWEGLFRVSSDFRVFHQLTNYDVPFPVENVEIDNTNNVVYVSQGYHNRDNNKVYTLDMDYANELPTPTPTNTPLPAISTFTPTALPQDPSGNPIPLNPYVKLNITAQAPNRIERMAANPTDGSLYYVHPHGVRTGWEPPFSSKRYYLIRGPLFPWFGYQPLFSQPEFTRTVAHLFECDDMLIAPNGNIYLADNVILQAHADKPLSDPGYRAENLERMTEESRFLNVPAGHVLCHDNHDYFKPIFWHFDPNKPTIEYHELTVPQATTDLVGDRGLYDICFGPDGLLYGFDGRKIVRFDENANVEIIHEFTGYFGSQMEYVAQDQAFYFVASENFSYFTSSNYVIYRYVIADDRVQPVLYTSAYIRDIAASGDGSSLYFFNHGDSKIWELIPLYEPGKPLSTPTATPGPAQPTPTPLPRDWFILDGFGGIHTSNPEARPFLPYFNGINIIRDLEPDPQGQGWYMLDGYGGIHTAPPSLAKPSDLPYFDFDIARDLEIIEKENGYIFIMLDGYGAVHHSGGDISSLNLDLPWFGIDMARDLEPTEDGNGWYTLDAYGAKFDTRDYSVSVAAGSYWAQRWFARDLLVLPDGSRLMLDSFAGRHSDANSTIWDRIKPIPPEFYFPGWEIIWDIETLPAE